MHIAFLSASGTLGGAEISLLELLGSLGRLNPRMRLTLVSGEDGPLCDRAREAGIAAFALGFPGALARFGDSGLSRPRMLASSPLAGACAAIYVYRLRRLLAELRPDVVHSNGYKMHVLSVAARPPGTPVVWHLHDYVSSRPLMREIVKRLAGRCSAAVANSRSVAQDATKWGLSGRIRCIYNAVNLDRLSPCGPAADLDRISGLPPVEGPVVRVGLAGTFARWKGHATFLRALARLSPELPWRAYIIGAPVYRTRGSQYGKEELQALAGELGVLHRVGFTGFVVEREQALRALDVVVHASTQPEPFGMVVAEAMACGRALVAAAAGGVEELVRDRHTALLHRPGEAADLAAKIELLVRNPVLRGALGRAARLYAETHFDSSRLAGEFLPVYRSAAAGFKADAAGMAI